MLLAPLLDHARTKPDATAIVDDRGETTYGQLAASAAALGAMLRRATDRQAVGILLPTSAAFASAFYGVLAAGKVPVPINFLLGAREVGHVIADSGIDTVLTAPPLADQLPAVPGLKVVDLTQLPTPTGAPDPSSVATAKPGDLAALLYTSGTSGPPKGVELTHANLDATVRATIDAYEIGGDQTFLGVIPLFHSTGLVLTLLIPVTMGVKTVYTARFNPSQTVKLVRDHGVTVMAAVPTMYGVIARLKSATPEDFATMYAAATGGEPLPSAVREGFKARFGVDLMEGYGLTETCGPIAANSPHHHRAGSVGRLLPGATLTLIDDDGSDLPPAPDAVGEVCFGGPTVMRGYHGLPDATAAAFSASDGSKYFRTGDLGRVDADGYLHLTGRKKDLVIVGGEKVHPREVEEAIARHPDVAAVAVIGRPDESRGEKVVAFVVPAEGKSVDANAVREFLRGGGMVGWKLPKDVHAVDALPLSPTGKVLKRELAATLDDA